MNRYDLINLEKIDKEEVIKEVINDTKEELKDLTTIQTCMIYSDCIRRKLKEKHVVNRGINTLDLGYLYEHQFTLVPVDQDTYYLIDLTYSQFQSDKLEELKKEGYLLVNNNTFFEYMKIVGKMDKDISLDDAYLETRRIVR